METEGYLGAAKMLVSTIVAVTGEGFRKKSKVVFLDQNNQNVIHCYATSVELRHAALMMTQAADQLDK